MQRVFLVHHMKRSGGHAVIDWLQDSEKGSVFINNEIPIQPILTGAAPLPDGSLSLEEWARRKPGDAALAIGRASTLFVSLEDHALDVAPFRHPGARLVVVLRQPESLFASRIRKASGTRLKAYDYEDPQTLGRAVALWKEHARAALGLVKGPKAAVGVLYDAWLVGERYRQALAGELGLGRSGRPPDRVTREGGGSSFAAKTVDPSALRRRAELLEGRERDVLAAIMADAEMRELAEEVAAATDSLAGRP